ncbi:MULTISPECIES: EamA family transporter [Ramlibacter]|uniref:EamA family transporter n=1 Tax=Ramlibacter aquaticus TaxID=2780094 RepID=A0ABR9SJ55_9BURK|nr:MULTISPECIES: EamA family transporter [Ramlibacter]MBE7942290.1 EamA family transporter [Ramlibacter aquaticus]
MPLHHLLLALAVVFVWGTNFVVIKWGLAEFPPFLLAGLRFLFTAVPLVFIFPRPAVPWRRLAAFGALLGAGQFGLLFLAMQHDISPGLASLVIQSQVFMTIAMALGSSGERLRGLQVGAMAVAVAGVAIIGWHSVGAGRSSVTPLGLAMVLAAAASWSGANMIARAAGRVNVIAFLAWSSPFSLPPLLALALWQSGPAGLAQALAHASWVGWSAVAWQTVGNTLFGYGAWNWLLARYPAATVTPTALLVPVFGMGASAWLLGEALPGWKLLAAALVMAGLALNTLASRVPRR